MSGNKDAEWLRNDITQGYMYAARGYAIYGSVTPDALSNKWVFEARVMLDCRLSSGSITGKALSCEGAQAIVEVLCSETGTCRPAS